MSLDKNRIKSFAHSKNGTQMPFLAQPSAVNQVRCTRFHYIDTNQPSE